MDDKLKRKMDDARERIQSKRVAITKEADPAMREQMITDVTQEERQLHQSLTDGEREQVEQRFQEVERQAAIPTRPRHPDSIKPAEAIPWQLNDEYYFLRRILRGE